MKARKTSYFLLSRRRKITLFLVFLHLFFFLVCGESCNRVSTQRFRTSEFTPVCNTDALNASVKSLFVCTLGSFPAEGGWAINLAVILSCTWIIWEMTVSHYELYVTQQKTVLFPSLDHWRKPVYQPGQTCPGAHADKGRSFSCISTKT